MIRAVSMGIPEWRSLAYSLTNVAEDGWPASIRMASSSVEGASTLSEVRVLGLCQYIFVSSFPKGRLYLCTRRYESETGAGTPASLLTLLFTRVRGRSVLRSTAVRGTARRRTRKGPGG